MATYQLGEVIGSAQLIPPYRLSRQDEVHWSFDQLIAFPNGDAKLATEQHRHCGTITPECELVEPFRRLPPLCVLGHPSINLALARANL
jgi:hypothetical protein